jgi:hypothetical protein
MREARRVPLRMRRLLPHALLLVCLAVLSGCHDAAAPVQPPPDPPAASASWARTRLRPLGGWRLDIPYAGEGLAIVPDASGLADAVYTSGHLQQDVLHRTRLRVAASGDSVIDAMPRLVPDDTLHVASVFPDLPSGQRVRDFAVTPRGSGLELAALGRVFYNTTPRAQTRIVMRALDASQRPVGAVRSMDVPLPEQEFSGFIKQGDASRDLAAIGGGGYESGQGSVGGISYAALRGSDWRRLLQPPGFGDLLSPRLPRDSAYACPGGASWVCLPPANGRGVWSTERLFGGGVRLGDTVLFLPTLGYGERTYERQSATFGDPARDRVSLYRFVHHTSDSVVFVAHEPWPFTTPGQSVHGMALGRLPGVTEPVLFVLVAGAWGHGASHDAPALLVYARITAP